MAQVPTFKNPNSLGFFSLATLFADAINRDWTQGYAEQWDEVLPRPTFGDVAEHAEELLSPAQRVAAQADPYGAITDVLEDAFQQSDGRDDWREGFSPMMNAAWQVSMGYEVEPQTAANLMAIFAPSCTLVERFADAADERLEETVYEIALNGGGMYLGDHIVAAYMCCGAMPPLELLRSLSQAGHSYVLPRLPMVEVFAEAQAHLRTLADKLGEELTRLQANAAEQAKG